MKNILFLLPLIWLSSCSEPKKSDSSTAKPIKVEQQIELQEKATEKNTQAFAEILSKADVDGGILVFDEEENTYLSNNFNRCRKGFLPASTFKIPNSIVAFESGVVKDTSTLFKWDGKPRRLSFWDKDMVFKQAFKQSCLPCYQEMARMVGYKRMVEQVGKLNYGNMVFDSTSYDAFWVEGESRITQFEQIDFLKRLYHEELPVSKRTYGMVKNMMIIEQTADYKISGKTGWSIRDGFNNGWFVGYVEKADKLYFFATNVEPNQEFNMDFFAKIRLQVTYEALKEIGVLSS